MKANRSPEVSAPKHRAKRLPRVPESQAAFRFDAPDGATIAYTRPPAPKAPPAPAGASKRAFEKGMARLARAMTAHAEWKTFGPDQAYAARNMAHTEAEKNIAGAPDAYVQRIASRIIADVARQAPKKAPPAKKKAKGGGEPPASLVARTLARIVAAIESDPRWSSVSKGLYDRVLFRAKRASESPRFQSAGDQAVADLANEIVSEVAAKIPADAPIRVTRTGRLPKAPPAPKAPQRIDPIAVLSQARAVVDPTDILDEAMARAASIRRQAAKRPASVSDDAKRLADALAALHETLCAGGSLPLHWTKRAKRV